MVDKDSIDEYRVVYGNATPEELDRMVRAHGDKLRVGKWTDEKGVHHITLAIPKNLMKPRDTIRSLFWNVIRGLSLTSKSSFTITELGRGKTAQTSTEVHDVFLKQMERAHPERKYLQPLTQMAREVIGSDKRDYLTCLQDLPRMCSGITVRVEGEPPQSFGHLMTTPDNLKKFLKYMGIPDDQCEVTQDEVRKMTPGKGETITEDQKTCIAIVTKVQTFLEGKKTDPIYKPFFDFLVAAGQTGAAPLHVSMQQKTPAQYILERDETHSSIDVSLTKDRRDPAKLSRLSIQQHILMNFRDAAFPFSQSLPFVSLPLTLTSTIIPPSDKAREVTCRVEFGEERLFQDNPSTRSAVQQVKVRGTQTVRLSYTPQESGQA